jgi:DNA primase
MSGRLSDDILQSVRERVSIVEVISSHVSLRKSGRNYLGLCPFHAEKTPSFTVSEERGLFHCFGCGAGGTVFTFLMRADRVEFREAVELLAKRAGVTLPQSTERGPGSDARQALISIHEAAQEHFVTALHSPRGGPAREYLKSRGLNPETVARYGLGFCPAEGAGLTRSLAAKGVVLARAADLGLVGRRSDGSTYDRFFGRVTFPIRDSAGRIVGFGGRTLGTNHPKYLNSPESALFHKGDVLYGLFEARQAIREAERVVIVEGYLDALALVEAGVGYTVASLGTALGPAQLRLARRFAPEIVAFFDGDRAGQEAAARAFAVCAETDVWGLGAFLPDGFDPDTFIRAHGKTATLSLLQHAVPLADFFIQRADPGPAASVPERARAAAKVAEVLSLVREPAQFSLLARKAAQQLGVDEEIFRARRTIKRAPMPGTPLQPSPTGRGAPSLRAEEVMLIETMALDRDVAQQVSERGILEHFENDVLADAGRRLAAAWEEQGGVEGAVDQLPDVIAKRITAGLLGVGALASSDHMQVAEHCITRMEERRSHAEARTVREQIQHAEARGDQSGSLEATRHADRLRHRRSQQWS